MAFLGVFKNKYFRLSILVSVAAIGVFFYTPFIFDYFEFREAKAVVATMPALFGGTVYDYQIACVSDPETGFCENCPICTGAIGPYVCNANSQILYTPVPGGGPGFIVQLKVLFTSAGGRLSGHIFLAVVPLRYCLGLLELVGYQPEYNN